MLNSIFRVAVVTTLLASSFGVSANAQIGGGPVTEQAEIQSYQGKRASAEWTGAFQFIGRGVLLRTDSATVRAGDILKHRSGTIPFQVTKISFDYLKYKDPRFPSEPRLVLRYRDTTGATVFTSREASQITTGTSKANLGTLVHCSLKNPYPNFTLTEAAVVALVRSGHRAKFWVVNFVLNDGEREKEQDFTILVDGDKTTPPQDPILNQ